MVHIHKIKKKQYKCTGNTPQKTIQQPTASTRPKKTKAIFCAVTILRIYGQYFFFDRAELELMSNINYVNGPQQGRRDWPGQVQYFTLRDENNHLLDLCESNTLCLHFNIFFDVRGIYYKICFSGWVGSATFYFGTKV